MLIPFWDLQSFIYRGDQMRSGMLVRDFVSWSYSAFFIDILGWSLQFGKEQLADILRWSVQFGKE